MFDDWSLNFNDNFFILHIIIIDSNIKILFESIGEKTVSVREVQCRCYRTYPEAVFLYSEDTISYRTHCRGDIDGSLRIEFVIPANFDSCS